MSGPRQGTDSLTGLSDSNKTRVCPEKDIVCGNRASTWCASCPNKLQGQPSVVDALVQIIEMDRSSLGDTEAWKQLRGIAKKALADTLDAEKRRAGDDALLDDAREALEIIVHDQAKDQFPGARRLIPRLRKRLGMPPIINFDTPELAPLAPAAEVVALTKLENDSTGLTPRIVALRTDLPVGTKLYTENAPAQSRSEQMRKQSVRFDLMGVVADVELGGGFGQLDPVCMATLKRCIGLLVPAQTPTLAANASDPCQLTAPDSIYLNVLADSLETPFPSFPTDTEGITWSEDKVGDVDVRYIRADLVNKLVAEGQVLEPLSNEEIDAAFVANMEMLLASQPSYVQYRRAIFKTVMDAYNQKSQRLLVGIKTQADLVESGTTMSPATDKEKSP